MHNFSPRNAKNIFDGKSILVTGGTGSFGKEFVRTVLKLSTPNRLIVLSRDEQKHFTMSQELSDKEYPALRYFLGDIRDRDRLELSMRGVDIVVHAAAQKHVPLAEYNPTECVQTNILGSENVVRAAMQAGVKKVLAISTDKAVNPINLYGATKLASEKIFVAANNLSGMDGPRFSVVRYGNVVGSNGSVIPLFQSLIKKGIKNLPITDERMTRFWITLEQGTNFVISAISAMVGGEVFVPKIASMKLIDLAKVLAPQLPHEIVGVRPGEKLHETLISGAEALNTVEFEDRYVIKPAFAFWEQRNLPESGTPVSSEFEYSSDTSPFQLNEESLQKMLVNLQ